MAKVLIVEDDRDVRRLIRALVEAEGHEVIEAGDGEEAMARLDDDPDVAFVDVDMPRSTGGEFILKLRRHPTRSQMPATFVTAHASRARPIQIAGLAGMRIIDKPFHKDDILDALEHMLTTMHRATLRVSLAPGQLTVDIDRERGCVVKNVAMGGVFAYTHHRHAVGTCVNASLNWRKERLESVVRVTHAQADGVGLAFVRASDELRESVQHIIDELLSREDSRADRRLAKRIPLAAAVLWSRGGEQTTGFLRDLSPDGAYIVAAEPPPVGTETQVYLPGYAYSNGQRVPSELRGCIAKVMRRTDDGFGCRFERPSAEFKMAVADLLKT